MRINLKLYEVLKYDLCHTNLFILIINNIILTRCAFYFQNVNEQKVFLSNDNNSKSIKNEFFSK